MDFLSNIGNFVASKVNIIDLGKSFKLMGQGMLGIFVVMTVISFIVYLLTKFLTNKQ